ncbi:MAG: hypothetical protein ACQEQC_01940 [Elusimicrobiota bacterium]
MKIVRLIVLFLLFTVSGLINPVYSSIKSMGRGYFISGFNTIDMDVLNNALESNNKDYPQFSDNFVTIGGAGYGMEKRLILGGEGFALTGEEKQKVLNGKSYTTSLSGGYGFFDIGFLLYPSKKVNIYPMIGVGGGGLSFKITGEETESFNSILNEPGKSVNMKTGGFLLNISIAADYLIILGEDKPGDSKHSGLALGVRGGYIYDPYPGDWTADDIAGIKEGPNLEITGPYIQLMLGGGTVTDTKDNYN